MLTIVHPCLRLSTRTVEKLLAVTESMKDTRLLICTPDATEAKAKVGIRADVIVDTKEGVYTAINRAIAQIPSGWIQVIGDTDTTLLTPEVLAHANCSSAEIILGAWYEGKNPDSFSLKTPTIPSTRSLGRVNTFNHQAALIHKNLHDRIGLYDTRYSVCADFDFIARALASNAKFETVSQPLATFTFGGLSSKDQVVNELERALAIRRNLASVPWSALARKILTHSTKNAIRKLIY